VPDWKEEISKRLATLKLAPAREAAIVEELAQHFDDCYAELLAGGATEAEAYCEVLAELSEREILAEELGRVERQVAPEPIVLGTNRGTNMVADLWQDLRLAARMLRKQPAFTLIAVLTLALGVGANTAVFSVVNTVLLQPLPYKDSQQLTAVWEVTGQSCCAKFSPAEFFDYLSQNQSFTEMAASRLMSFSLTGQGDAEQLDGLIVSANYFSLLGVAAEHGRALHPADGLAGAPRVAVISHDFWQTRFGGDRNVIGKTLTLSGESVTLIGVMPRGFQDTDQNTQRQIWVNPHQVVPDWQLNSPVDLLSMRLTGYLRVIARLKPNVSLPQAQADLDNIAARLQQQYPRPIGHGARVISLQEQTVGDVRPILWLLLGAVSLVLLIACANVTGLLLTRATERAKEIAIRTALGASRGQIVRQLLVEGLLLAGLGSLGGWLLAVWSVRLMVAAGLRDIPRLSEVGVDYRVFAFTLTLSVLTGLVFGLIPALAAAKVDLNATLKEGARSATPGRNRLRQTLVVAEVALALVVLLGAGLLVSSFARLLAVKPGFDPQHLLTMRIGLTDERYRKSTDKKQFVNLLNARLEALPGVESVGIGDDLPIAGTDSQTRLKIKDQTAGLPNEFVSVGLHVINPHYFDALGTRLLKGRAFTARDASGAPSVFIINETLARGFWPNEDPLGKQIRYNSNDPWGEIVGVVEDVKYDGLHLASTAHLFEPYQQNAWPFLSITIRSELDKATLLTAVRREVKALDPNVPVSGVSTMEEVMAQSLATRRFVLLLFSLFAGLAVSLTSVGIYGVLTSSVAQRTRELGIRLALGATARDVWRLVIRQGMRLVSLGLGLGLVSALALNRLIKKLLFGVGSTDPLTYVVIGVGFIGVALLACWLPARRATKVDALIALRSE
jgi:putative ABC transport system permease protein